MLTMKAIYIEQTGGPEVLRFGDRATPEPAPGEALVKIEYSGVNFTDLNQRSGVNKIPLPALLGAKPARSELTYLLVGLDRQFTAEAPGEPWEPYYARRIIEQLAR